ncbi:MAG: S41 family peptidase [Spirochaetes bacterium]|nr:S41 family peptidase [Spirochaetota bacterium]
MEFSKHGIRSSSIVWALACLLSLGVGFFAVSVPEAAAQSAQAEDDKRYSQLLQMVYQFIIKNYVDEVDPAKLYQGAMKGMLDSLGDPHSFFLDADMLSDLMRESDGKYAGVGLYISKTPGTSAAPVYVDVVSPIEDTPAWKAGVQPGDVILAINGESTADMAIDQASNKIRGPAGSSVKVRLRRGSTFEFELELVRAIIEIPAVKSAIIPYEGRKLGYLRIVDWIPQTADRLKEHLANMEEEKVDGFIVDVRSNPGGLLSSVVDVSDLFLDSGLIVSTKGRNSEENLEYKADPAMVIPAASRMVVLINKGSASASEIFAGAMKDRRRALLMGERSYGKGSVQQIFPIDQTGFKLTMARYYSPSGANIDKKGIDPDIPSFGLELSSKQLEVLKNLYDLDLFKDFAVKHPSADSGARKSYALELAKTYDLPVVYLDRMIRDELERGLPARIYDLEFDTQLLRAMEVVSGPDFEELLAKTKTLSQMVAGR